MGKWFVVLFSYITVFFLGLGKVSLFAILFSYTSSRGIWFLVLNTKNIENIKFIKQE